MIFLQLLRDADGEKALVRFDGEDRIRSVNPDTRVHLVNKESTAPAVLERGSKGEKGGKKSRRPPKKSIIIRELRAGNSLAHGSSELQKVYPELKPSAVKSLAQAAEREFTKKNARTLGVAKKSKKSTEPPSSQI